MKYYGQHQEKNLHVTNRLNFYLHKNKVYLRMLKFIFGMLILEI